MRSATSFPAQTGQSGAVLLLNATPICLDNTSRPEAFDRLYPKLLGGYLLDALEHLDREGGRRDEATAFVARVDEARTARTRPSVSGATSGSMAERSSAAGSNSRAS